MVRLIQLFKSGETLETVISTAFFNRMYIGKDNEVRLDFGHEIVYLAHLSRLEAEKTMQVIKQFVLGSTDSPFAEDTTIDFSKQKDLEAVQTAIAEVENLTNDLYYYDSANDRFLVFRKMISENEGVVSVHEKTPANTFYKLNDNFYFYNGESVTNLTTEEVTVVDTTEELDGLIANDTAVENAYYLVETLNLLYQYREVDVEVKGFSEKEHADGSYWKDGESYYKSDSLAMNDVTVTSYEDLEAANSASHSTGDVILVDGVLYENTDSATWEEKEVTPFTIVTTMPVVEEVEYNSYYWDSSESKLYKCEDVITQELQMALPLGEVPYLYKDDFLFSADGLGLKDLGCNPDKMLLDCELSQSSWYKDEEGNLYTSLYGDSLNLYDTFLKSGFTAVSATDKEFNHSYLNINI